MRRPGYLGSLNDFWGVRTPGRQYHSRQIRSLGYLGKGDHDDDGQKEAEKLRRKAAEMEAKRQREVQKRQKAAQKRQEEMREQQRDAEEDRYKDQMKEQKAQQKEMKKYEPVTATQAPNISIPTATPLIVPAALAPTATQPPQLSPALPIPVPPTDEAAVTAAPISTAAFVPKMVPYMPGHPMPMMASRPGMSQGLPIQRTQALPGRASPGPAPIITPQMARLGKIAAAIGAGMFLL